MLQKRNKENYLQVLKDLEVRGWDVAYHTIEIGTLGQWLNLPSRVRLKLVHFHKKVTREILDKVAHSRVVCQCRRRDDFCWTCQLQMKRVEEERGS